MIAQPIAIAIGVPLTRWILENIHGPASPVGAGYSFSKDFRRSSWALSRSGISPTGPRKPAWLPDDEKQWLIGELKADEARKVAATPRARAGCFAIPADLLADRDLSF